MKSIRLLQIFKNKFYNIILVGRILLQEENRKINKKRHYSK